MATKTKPPITDVATTDMADMMKPIGSRRMPMKGFDDHFVDIADYIVRITSWIWDDKNPDLCRNYYSDDCPIHTLAGEITGVNAVIEGTKNTLVGFPDRTLDAINVVWSGDEDKGYHSSHLIMSDMTNEGPSEFGPATGKHTRFHTIADCLCLENKIIEEWLMRDNLAIVKDLGFDPFVIAENQARQDVENGDELTNVHLQEIDRIRSEALPLDMAMPDVPEEEPEKFAAYAIAMLLGQSTPDQLDAIYDFRADVSMPDNKRLYGRKDIAAYFAELHGMFSDPRVTVDHVGDIPYMETGRDISVRWSFTGIHTGNGRYGEATGKPIRILGATHWRVINGRIHREWTIFDELAVLRQVATARLTS